MFPKQASDMVPFFLSTGNELGISYSLDFVPAKASDAKPRKIEIRIRGGNYTVHQSRDTYAVK